MDSGTDSMSVLGFTTTASLLKEQSEAVKAEGIEAFGVSVIDDMDGKHEPIKASNAQLHLFMQLKRGNVTHLLFQSAEQADIFLENMESYYGKEKASKALSSVQFMVTGDAGNALQRLDVSSINVSSLEDALGHLNKR